MRRMTMRVATRSGGNVAWGPSLGAGRVIVESNVGRGAYDASGRDSGGWPTALVYDMRPLASRATPTEVSSAGSRRNRNRFQTAFTAGSLPKDPVAAGRRVDGALRPARALALRAIGSTRVQVRSPSVLAPPSPVPPRAVDRAD